VIPARDTDLTAVVPLPLLSIEALDFDDEDTDDTVPIAKRNADAANRIGVQPAALTATSWARPAGSVADALHDGSGLR